MGIQKNENSILAKPAAVMAVSLILLLSAPPLTNGGIAEWCIADPQTPPDLLQNSLNWACAQNGTDCTAIQGDHICYLPNKLVSHASYAFNSYWQNNKHNGASCLFNSAAFVTETNPSHGACRFIYVP